MSTDADESFCRELERRFAPKPAPPPPSPVVRKRPTHTITETYGSQTLAFVDWAPHYRHQSGPLDCGGYCCLAPNHIGPCECCGDEPGCPGSCPH